MQNVARGVGLGGLATLILAGEMAAPAVAEIKINVPAIHVDVKSPKVGNPTPTPSFKMVVPQNSKSNLGRPPSVKAGVLSSKSSPGGNNLISIQKEVDQTTPALERHGPILSDPSLRLTLASAAGAHRNQLDYEGSFSGPGGGVYGDSNNGVSTVTVDSGGKLSVVFYMSGGHGFFNSGTETTYW
jgi:hypothetical protein